MGVSSSLAIMKTLLCLFALVAAASAYAQCGKKGSGGRIINGVDAGHGEFPWQISLRFGRYGHICGGTLIGNQWVLCAAHCFGQTKNPAAYTVRIGEWYLKSNDGIEKDHRLSELHVHESYNYPKQFNNDIAHNTGPFPITLLDSESPAKAGPPAWETPAVPSSAPTAAVPTTSSELSPSDPELAPANPAFSPKLLLTDHGCPRNPEVPSKHKELKILCLLQLFRFFLLYVDVS